MLCDHRAVEAKQTLKSRLMILHVRALSASEAVAFLEDIANWECIGYDRKALALLAGLKCGHPRDLLIGLEQVQASYRQILVTEGIRRQRLELAI